jgi:hypothetical protein
VTCPVLNCCRTPMVVTGDPSRLTRPVRSFSLLYLVGATEVTRTLQAIGATEPAYSTTYCHETGIAKDFADPVVARSVGFGSAPVHAILGRRTLRLMKNPCSEIIRECEGCAVCDQVFA